MSEDDEARFTAWLMNSAAPMAATGGRLALLALPLNFLWEIAQAPAFGPMGATWWEGVLVCTRAALGDVVIFVALFGLGVTALGRRWFAPPEVGPYTVITMVAVLIQISVEWVARATGRWDYQPWHPTLFGAGLLPILQAVILVPVSFVLLARWEANR